MLRADCERACCTRADVADESIVVVGWTVRRVERERPGATLQLVAFALLINSSIWVADYPIPSVCFSAAVLRMFSSEKFLV